jgi:thiol-disulfide isomerase/thioredoxin
MDKMRTLLLIFAFLSYGQLRAQPIDIIKFNQLETMMKSFSHDVAVFNFWATWCKPCIEEMPYLEEARGSYNTSQLGVYLISMDDVEMADTKVKKFIEKKGYTSRVLLLDETDYNSFIDKIDPKWSGTIPATVIIDKKNGKKYFYSAAFKENELKEILAKIVTP